MVTWSTTEYTDLRHGARYGACNGAYEGLGKSTSLKVREPQSQLRFYSPQLHAPQVTSLGLSFLILHLSGFIRRKAFSHFNRSVIWHKTRPWTSRGIRFSWEGNTYTDKDKEQSKGPHVRKQMAGTSKKCSRHHRTSGKIILSSLSPPVNFRTMRIIIRDTTPWGRFDNEMKTK